MSETITGRNEWLTSLKAGDLVVMEWGYGYTARHLTTVSRTTDTQVIVTNSSGREEKYRRSDGRKVAGEWHQRIEEATPARIDSIRKKMLVDKMMLVKWGALPLETLEAISKVLP